MLNIGKMFNIMRADLFRIHRSYGILVFWALIVLGSVLPIVSDSEIAMGINFVTLLGGKKDIIQLTYNFNLYYFLIIPIYSIAVSDLSKRTVKNTVASTVSRGTYYAAKTVLCLFYCLFAFFVYDMIIYVLNRAVNGAENATELSKYITACLDQLPVMIMIALLLVMAAFLLGRASAFNACVIGLPFGFQILLGILMQIEAIYDFVSDNIKYELSVMLSYLAAEPSADYKTACFIISAVGCAAALFIGYFAFRKRELK